MRMLVYSHDAYGLGNIRRMLAICEHLLQEIPGISILLLSGSPMVQGFRLPKGLDYIKLPCLNRGSTGEVAVKYLGIGLEETVRLRSQLILSAAINFQPDLFLVDKKPYGVKNELADTIHYFRRQLPQTKLVLLLRDILDSPQVTVADWTKNGYYAAIEKFYHQVLIVGTPEVFHTVQEYEFSPNIARKSHYCGYIGRKSGLKSPENIRNELQVSPGERLILVTPGGGEDGYELVDTYLGAIKLLAEANSYKSLIIYGPEMPQTQKQLIMQVAENNPQVQVREFTDDLMSYIQAADAIVSMAGYNTVCEIVSANKPAVIIPRSHPSKEQLIRAQRMAKLGLFPAINPGELSPEALKFALVNQLPISKFKLSMNGLDNVKKYLYQMLTRTNYQCLFNYEENHVLLPIP
ncbi:glycosyltransferase family protein [Anabaena subtropica]|uniref:Glycosyltransferase n=1 Tax=Anabaena subtropica FACHB-260 TaxID=2692884 RepID=A0ABR8CP31_9NOST|nr:glycosyltransferase family protein [Anabaena subtropica]MBD2344561.1 glycosyltransferase [Anabaena subtropica FACHB-260]